MPISKSSQILLVLLIILAVLVGLRLLDARLAPSLFDVVGSDAWEALNTPWFHLGERTAQPKGLDVTPALIVQVVLFIVFLTIAARLGRRILHTRVLARTSLDAGQRYAISNIFAYVVFLLGLMVGLQTAGLDLSSLAFLGGAVGVGIGFGLQAIVNNFVSGLILLVERPIQIGDRVEVGGTIGEVIRIGPRSTWVRGINHAMIIVPNSEFITGRVSNWTAVESRAQFTVPVNVAYESDPETVRSLLLDVARTHPDVQKDPPPDAVLVRLGEYSLHFELRFWTSKQVHTPPQITSEIYFGILKAFRQHGVQIPVPQRDLHVKSVPDAFSTGGRV